MKIDLLYFYNFYVENIIKIYDRKNSHVLRVKNRKQVNLA